MFNYFKKFIDGLKNSRFIYQDETKETEPELTEGEEGTVEAGPETKGKAAEQAEYDLTQTLDQSKSMRQAREHEGPELGEKLVTLSKRDKDRFKEHGIDTIAGKLRPMGKETPEEVPAVEPEKDVILEKAETLAAEEEAKKELASLGVTEKPQRPAEALAPKEKLAKAAKAAAESATAELAYINEQLGEANEDKVRDWVAYTRRFAEGIAKGRNVAEITNQLQTEIPRDAKNIGYMAQVVEKIAVTPGETEQAIAGKLVDALKNYTDNEKIKKAFDDQLTLLYG